ncbi:uncharacterized protein Z518_05682 [Rhinocladiella mackenziei CBS 650.93]|uniref:Transcription factor domain-containing protein n=1 Tax=Rhinocladiella mackenziei CBS 650.93 TaxID=1442369 RepID=A0A0D2INV2_9EURO|nr:uncharacterized protein Z518_05682 [Rhinocladiella mackenziei CBS 650.93]KIX04811.1 hypothetical protein Z518_05682 [Rhinocladiella mackenziei CBS 650.93]
MTSSDSGLRARLQRVERLLDRLIEVDDTNESESLPNLGSGDGSVTAPIEGDHQPPLISLFDNAVFGRQEQSTPSEDPSPQRSTLSATNAKTEKLRLPLIALLPSQEDADLITASTNGWGLRQVVYAGDDPGHPIGDIRPFFDILSLSKASAVTIARFLLYLAICIQQLPPEFDAGKLHFSSPIETVLQKYLNSVTDLVTSKDDLVCSMEGLEVLLLQSLFYINDGNLRRAWLCGRRTMNMAQFMGLQKAYLRYMREQKGDEEKFKATMWLKVVIVDRYLAVLLGFPVGVGDDCFGDESYLRIPISGLIDLVVRRLSIIAGLIATRNQRELLTTYTHTLEIDEKLDQLARELPKSWCEIPVLCPGERTLEEANKYDLITHQMWYFQLTQLLHLPWMLRAFTDSRYEYSKLSCLNASREMIIRYLALRSMNNTQMHARVVDFATIIASVTIILIHVGSGSNIENQRDVGHRKHSDMELVNKVVESMRVVAQGSREFMARQGVEVVEALLSVGETGKDNGARGKLQLTIPFYGTIHITRNMIPVNATRDQQKADDPIDELLQSQYADAAAYDQISGVLGPGFGHHLSFDQANISDPSWFPPLEAWDLDNMAASTIGDSYSLWDINS